MLTEEDVRLAWRYILGRDPESPDVAQAHLQHGDIDVLRRILFDSDEFRAKYTQYTKSVNRLRFAEAPVTRAAEGDATKGDATLSRLFARIQAQWVALGETEPYWSVMTSPRYRMDRIEATRAEFFEAGRHAWRGTEATLRRNGAGLSPGSVAVEIGCGVGRVSVHAAAAAGWLHGYDISPGNLALARGNADAFDVRNASFHLLTALEDFGSVVPFDALFSTIVLQHNPPPVQRWMLARLAARAKPGGIMCIQAATYAAGYRWDAAAYLATPPALLDMHVLPQADIFEVLQQAGFSVLEVMEDNAIAHPEWLSTNILARKTGAAPPA